MYNRADRGTESGTASPSPLLGRNTSEAAIPSRNEIISSRLESYFNERALASMKATELAAVLGVDAKTSKKTSASICAEVGALLDAIGIGFEPDPRYGPRSLSSDCDVILFKSEDGAPVDRGNPSYTYALTMIEVAALAAAADDKIANEEIEFIISELNGALDLEDAERVRLLAFAWATLHHLPWQQEVIDRVAKLSDRGRHSVVQSAISTVLADRRVMAAEVRFLENLHKLLGFEFARVRQALQRGMVVMDKPDVAVTTQSIGSTPVSPPTPVRMLAVDIGRLARIKRETTVVSDLLAGIFADDAPPPHAWVRDVGSEYVTHGFVGLDEAHGRLVAAVLAADVVPRQQFEELARSLRLLPDGALETINEWGFDTFEAAVLEGEDMIAVVEQLRADLENRTSAT
jgi:hypothetical protein